MQSLPVEVASSLVPIPLSPASIPSLMDLSTFVIFFFLENRGSLFFLRGSEMVFCCSPKRSWTKSAYCSCRSIYAFVTDAIESCSMISLVSKVIKSPLSSKKGFPRSWMASIRFPTSFLKETYVLWDFAWCSGPGHWEKPSNSWIMRDISGPATIHLLRAAAFSVRPTAPPSPLTRAFNCSCAWSSAIPENDLVVLCATNLPSKKWVYTEGWSVESEVISLKWIERLRD